MILICENETELIFQRYYRSQSATQIYVVGSGIGLGIAREILRLHGGEIIASPSIETPLGWKTTITIILPIDMEKKTYE